MKGLIMINRIDYAKASPEGFKAFGGVYVYLQNSGLPKELIYLVFLRVSQDRDRPEIRTTGRMARSRGATAPDRLRHHQCDWSWVWNEIR